MMKKLMTAALCLVLILCACVTALAADATLLKARVDEEDYFSVRSVTAVGDTLYILGYLDDAIQLYRWQEGMADAEMVADDLFIANRYNTLEEAVEAQAEAKDPLPGDPEHAVGETVFTDGERLLVLNPLNGKVFALNGEDGKAVYEDVCTISDMTLLKHVSPDYSYFLTPENKAYVGGKLLMRVFDWDEETGMEDPRVVSLDLATGELARVEMEHVQSLTGYKDGRVLLLIRDPETAYDSEKEAYRPYDMVSYDPATGATETVGQLDGDYISNLVYSPNHDALIYLSATRIMGATGLGEPEQYGYAPVTWGDSLCMIGDSIAFRGNGYAYVRSLTPGFDTESQVTIYGSYMSKGAKLFTDKYPQTPLYFDENYYGDAEELSQAMVTGDNAMDVLELNTSYSAFFRLMEKGYCADLSGSEVLMDYVNRLHPALRDAVMKDGKLYAIPTQAYSYDGWFVNRQVMEDIGLTEEELPTNFVELCELATRWNDEWVEEFPNYSLISYVENYRESIFWYMWNEYVNYYTVRGEELRFDAPVFREMMAALEAMRVDELDRGANIANEDEVGYRAGLFMTGYPVVSNFIDPTEEGGASIFVPMTLTEDTEYTVTAEVQVLFINPKTQNMTAALNLLECMTAALNMWDEHTLLADATDPVPNEYYDELVESANEYLQLLKDDMAKADEAEKRNYEEQIAEQEAYIKTLDNEKFSISEGDIRFYQETVVPAMYVGRPSVMQTSDEASEQVWTLAGRYLAGQIKAEQLIKELDGKIRMMQMEDY